MPQSKTPILTQLIFPKDKILIPPVPKSCCISRICIHQIMLGLYEQCSHLLQHPATSMVQVIRTSRPQARIQQCSKFFDKGQEMSLPSPCPRFIGLGRNITSLHIQNAIFIDLQMKSLL